jgi:adenylate cyclase
VAAHDEFLKGWGHYLRFTPTDFEKAVSSFRKAIELDPNYGRAYAALALVHWTASTNVPLSAGLRGMYEREARMRSREYLKKAVKQPTSITYDVSSQMYLQRRQHKEAIAELEQGLALDPNDPSCYQSMGYTLIMDGRPKEAIEYVNKGKRLDPLNPSRYLYLLGLTHFCMGDLTEAAAFLEKAQRLNPENEWIAFDLAALYGLIGRDQDARVTLNTVRKKVLGSTNAGNLRTLMFYKPFKGRAVAERYAEGILKAGMPGQPSGYYPAFKENQLTGEKIMALLFGSAITGINYLIGPWWIDCKKNGEFIWRGITSSDIGKSRIEGDMICIQYQERWWGLEQCGTVFRNPSGTPERKNEYFFFGDFAYDFSPVR